MPEEKESWLDRTSEELEDLILNEWKKSLETKMFGSGEIKEFVEKKLRESYKNGAMAERRKHERSAETFA